MGEGGLFDSFCCCEESKGLESVREVVDSHVHFSGVGGLTSKFHDAAYFGEGAKRRDAYTEEEFEIQAVACGLDVDRCVFVECMLGDAVAEASWALERCRSHDSKIGAVVAHAPAPDGGDAVEEFLRRLPGCDAHRKPAGLAGGRVVLLGDPMPHKFACLDPLYGEGLGALHARGLHWEWCCRPESLPAVATQSSRFPDMTFVLDHCGHNAGGDDFKTWSRDVAALADRCPNILCKLGASEEWGLQSEKPGQFIKHAISVFGADRCLYESNFFVGHAAHGLAYDHAARLTYDALAGGQPGCCDDEDAVALVFAGNAKRVYGLGY